MNSNEQQMMPREPDGLVLPNDGEVEQMLVQVARFQQLVRRSFIEGHDYGVIPGTNKPTLLKPGAEKLTKLMGLADTYEIMDRVQDWDKGLFAYEIRCRLVTTNGVIVSEGVGECNSYESKYRYRNAKPACPKCGAEAITKSKEDYGGGWFCWNKKGGCDAKWEANDPAITNLHAGRVLNEDPADQKNTILKMAKKRALVDAALSAGRLSDLFTQDLDETKPKAKVVDAESRPVKPRRTAPPESEGVPPQSDSVHPDNGNGAFARVGDLLTHALDTYGLSREQVMEAFSTPEAKIDAVGKIPFDSRDARKLIKDFAITNEAQAGLGIEA